MAQANTKKITSRPKQQISESGRIKTAELAWKSDDRPVTKGTVSFVKSVDQPRQKAAPLPGKAVGKKIASHNQAATTPHCSKDNTKENQNPQDPKQAGQGSLRDLCPEDKRRVKSLVEEVARLGCEKEKLESEMNRERAALKGLLENLKTQHHKVVEEKKELEMELTSSQLKVQSLEGFKYLHATSLSHDPGFPAQYPPSPASYTNMRLTPSKHSVSKDSHISAKFPPANPSGAIPSAPGMRTLGGDESFVTGGGFGRPEGSSYSTLIGGQSSVARFANNPVKTLSINPLMSSCMGGGVTYPSHFPVANPTFDVTAEAGSDTEPPHPLLPNSSGSLPSTSTITAGGPIRPSTFETTSKPVPDAGVAVSMGAQYSNRQVAVPKENAMAHFPVKHASYLPVYSAAQSTKTSSHATTSTTSTTQPANRYSHKTTASEHHGNQQQGSIGIAQCIPQSVSSTEGILKSPDVKVCSRALSSSHQVALHGNSDSDDSASTAEHPSAKKLQEHKLSQSHCSEGSAQELPLHHQAEPRSKRKLFQNSPKRSATKECTKTHSKPGKSLFLEPSTTSTQKIKTSSRHRLSPEKETAVGSRKPSSREDSKVLHSSPPSGSRHRFSMQRRRGSVSNTSKAEVVSAGTQTLNCESIGVQTEDTASACKEISDEKAASTPKTSSKASSKLSPMSTTKSPPPKENLRNDKVSTANQQPAMVGTSTAAPVSASLEPSGNNSHSLTRDDLTIHPTGAEGLKASRDSDNSPRPPNTPSKPTVHIIAGHQSNQNCKMPPASRSHTSSKHARIKSHSFYELHQVCSPSRTVPSEAAYEIKQQYCLPPDSRSYTSSEQARTKSYGLPHVCSPSRALSSEVANETKQQYYILPGLGSHSTSSRQGRLENSSVLPEVSHSNGMFLSEVDAGAAFRERCATGPGSEDLMLSAILNLEDEEAARNYSGYRLGKSHTECETSFRKQLFPLDLAVDLSQSESESGLDEGCSKGEHLSPLKESSILNVRWSQGEESDFAAFSTPATSQLRPFLNCHPHQQQSRLRSKLETRDTLPLKQSGHKLEPRDTLSPKQSGHSRLSTKLETLPPKLSGQKLEARDTLSPKQIGHSRLCSMLETRDTLPPSVSVQRETTGWGCKVQDQDDYDLVESLFFVS